MRHSVTLALALLLALAQAALAQQGERAPSRAYKGIWVSTPFPAFNIPAGEPVTLDLNVHNSGLPPQQVALRVERVPDGWSAAFLGEGKRVQSVFVAPGDKAAVKLRLQPAGKASGGTQRFEVVAAGADARFRLPIELTVGQSLPPRLSLRSELPELRGSPSSEFDFKVAVRNDGGEDATVRVDVGVPNGFRAKVTEQYGSQEITSLPIKVGEEKTLSVKVTPSSGAKQDKYPVMVRASSEKARAQIELVAEVSGEPKLELTGREERVSASATAGEESPIELVIANRGSAPAQDVKLEANAPSGWKVSFQPERLELIAPNETKTATALVTPSAKAIAGDYMVNVRALTGGGNESSEFRVTVRTSTLWGVVGILIIAAAVVVLVAAMLRYGRR
jgi:uncharacterized membrane protein